MAYGNRPTWKRLVYSPMGIIVGSIALLLLVRAGWNIHEKAVVAGARLSEAQAELSGLEQQKAALSSSIAYLSTPAGMEAELRDKYHAVKEGESVAVIVDDDAGAASSTATSTLSESWWHRFMDFIGF